MIIAAPDKIASYHKLDHELNLKEILPEVTDVDLILVESYRTEHFPTIEVVRSKHFAELLSRPENLIAIVSDLKFDLPIPQFFLDDVNGIADFIALQCPEKMGQTVKGM